MPKFMMAYIPDGRKPEDRQDLMQRWQAWVHANADALVEPQNPLSNRKTIDENGVSDEGTLNMMGYSILYADTQEAALAIVRTCPFLEIGAVELAQIKEM